MQEVGPNIDMSLASLAAGGDDNIPSKAFGDKDDLNLPDFVKTRTAADVKNAADVAEKILEFLSLIEKGEKIEYSEYGSFKPIIKMLMAIARPSLPSDEIEESLDEMLARLSEEEVEEVVAEAEEDEDVKVKVKVDAEDLEDEVDVNADAEEESPAKNDSIVIDKKIVSLSSLPGDTRKILDTLETLRAQAEEFGDQKFITQVGNTITFFTRDFVVAGDAPNPAGIEERDGELDVNIDSEKSTAEMEAGLGLEEVLFPMWKKLK